jgi:hypothetical protein
MNDRTAIMLVRLEHSIQNDFRWLKELREEILFTMESARLMGDIRGADTGWKASLDGRLAELDHLFQKAGAQLENVRTAVDRKDRPAMIEALDAAESSLPEETALDDALMGVRTQLAEATPEMLRDWHTHEQMLKGALHRLRALIRVLGTRLTLLNHYTEKDVDPMIRAALSSKPLTGQSVAATQEYIDKYRQASLDVHHDQHQPGDILDDIKAMFLWVDNPEERLNDPRRKKKVVVQH